MQFIGVGRFDLLSSVIEVAALRKNGKRDFTRRKIEVGASPVREENIRCVRGARTCAFIVSVAARRTVIRWVCGHDSARTAVLILSAGKLGISTAGLRG